MPNYTSPHVRAKHPCWVMPQAVTCPDAEVTAHPDGETRTASPDPTTPPKGCHEHQPVVPPGLGLRRTVTQSATTSGAPPGARFAVMKFRPAGLPSTLVSRGGLGG